MVDKKNDIKDTTKIIKENVKLLDKYWNEKKTWSRAEILELIRKHISIDDIV